MSAAITVYNPAVRKFINPDAAIETLAGDCAFTEGPVWNSEGYYLCSDITANCIYKLIPGRKKQVLLAESGTANPSDPDLKPDQVGSNGLAYDERGELLVCRHGSHAIARYKGHGLEPFLSGYEGRPFNSPNDLVVHPGGKLYFSDPPYGLKDGQLNPSKFQPLAAVYAWREGEIKRICERYQYPNGVCLSPDHSLLYICSNKPFENFISVYDTATDAFIKELARENSDGIKCDRAGNLYLCNKDGIIILDPAGERLALISLPTVPANICWGGELGNDLFITARQNIFLIRGLQR
ncbi:MAG TPA: SMP-30/gluconolactonase/LRE family protein [Flavisolibacter sp.]|nr:SMP-30/gluconolactonase/LRE family protein [Flavisolibacter sp.]